MIIGNQLRALREFKNLSQGDIEERTGLLRCYISRVENGHTVPALETLEKFARALEVPLYAIFHNAIAEAGDSKSVARWKIRDRQTERLVDLMARLSQAERQVLLATAREMARKGRKRRA